MVRDGSLGSVFPATPTATTAANLTTTAPGPAVPAPNASYGSAAAAGPRSLYEGTGGHAAAAGRVIFPLAADAEVHQAPAAAAATTAAAATEDLVGSEMLERVLRHRELFLQ